jgi:thiol-disulfide isomerase/thioredoxin
MVRLRFALLIALALLPTVPAAAQETLNNPPPPLRAGTRAPAFTTRTLQGKPLSLRSLRGKVVLLDYWATWCGPCQMATPTIESLHKRFGKKGLAVVGMSVDQADSLAQVKPFVKHFGMTYIVTASPQANGQAAAKYHAHGIPAQYLIDKKGIVRWSQEGFAPDEGPKLAAKIRRLLAEK